MLFLSNPGGEGDYRDDKLFNIHKFSCGTAEDVYSSKKFIARD